MKDTIVLYPCPSKGHLFSMLEFAKLISKHRPSLSVTLIIPTLPNEETNSVDSIIATATSINFIRLPPAALPTVPTSFGDIVASLFELPQLNNPNLHQALLSLSNSSVIKAFIIDFFCNAAVEISSALKIPTYYYFTSGVSPLCNLLYTSTLDKNFTQEELLNVETVINCPGLPTMSSGTLPLVLLDRSHRSYRYFVETSIQMGKSAGLIANTFESLELTAVKGIREGNCTPAEPRPPPLYCIGPVIGKGESKNEEECLSWLDSQPVRSVVFLCFGSMGVFSANQLKEMAIGLEKSEVRFLWIVRPPPADGETKGECSLTVLNDLEYLLPEGFLERTKGKGLVVKMWAPQVKVLSHESVGGFVTHCGWNSILESVCAGVPMLAWPLYAEQKVNGLALVEELKLALRVTELEDGLVKGDEFAMKLSELMNSDEGRGVRERVTAMKYEALNAQMDGGSSQVALAHLLDSLRVSDSQNTSTSSQNL
ncbi:UDP-glycosyltransferase 88B1-like [Euphorbia lathyris]|uniref:UDP-glycosyltransferase 88B1-like n=1 Tax=Euphorbia lathyris TaxID=212925 RepID=UPI0033131ABD